MISSPRTSPSSGETNIPATSKSIFEIETSGSTSLEVSLCTQPLSTKIGSLIPSTLAGVKILYPGMPFKITLSI